MPEDPKATDQETLQLPPQLENVLKETATPKGCSGMFQTEARQVVAC